MSIKTMTIDAITTVSLLLIQSKTTLLQPRKSTILQKCHGLDQGFTKFLVAPKVTDGAKKVASIRAKAIYHLCAIIFTSSTETATASALGAGGRALIKRESGEVSVCERDRDKVRRSKDKMPWSCR